MAPPRLRVGSSTRVSIFASVLVHVAGLAQLRGIADKQPKSTWDDPATLSTGLPLCPQYAALSWEVPQPAGAPDVKDAQIVSVYSEVAAFNSTGDAQFAAMWTHLGAMGLLHDRWGRSYGYFSALGSAAHVSLLKSGAEVDITRLPAPPAQHGYLSFQGMEAALELSKDDVWLANGTARPVSFMMKLHLDKEAYTWKGWPRSFGYTLSGYIHLPSQGVWRLLADVQGRVVTNGVTNFGGFLGGFGSFTAPLGKGTACQSAAAKSRAGPAWYQLDSGLWVQLKSTSPPGAAAPPSWIGRTSVTMAAGPNAAIEPQTSHSSEESKPRLLSGFPIPEGDNSPAGDPAHGLRHFGPKHHRLEGWGQFYNQSRVYSCVTPDLAAVMADPGQYQPPPKKVPDFDAQGFCEPLVAEHFWWTPPSVAQKDIEWFYNEITVEESAPYTYFMANGFQGGYFGIQEHPNGLKYALFSVWDAGSKVEIVDWGEGVKVGRFGNEGTGANSNLEFQWKIGEPVQFLVHAEVEKPKEAGGPTTTLYSGYIRLPSLGVWRLMSKLRVQPCGPNVHTGGHLLGMNSFIEVFQHLPKKPDCDEYSRTRRARYGVPWYRRAGSSTWEPFGHVTLTSTCPKEGCPRRGMDFEALEVGGQDAFVLTVGGNVTNKGMPLSQPRVMHAAQAPPFVLTETPLPLSDNSVAGKWKTFEARPLRSLGKHEQLKTWGNGPDELACPWYVSDCALPGGLPEEDYIR